MSFTFEIKTLNKLSLWHNVYTIGMMGICMALDNKTCK